MTNDMRNVPVRFASSAMLDDVLGARRFLAHSKLVHVLGLANHVGSLKRRVAVAVLRGGVCPSSLRLVAGYLGYEESYKTLAMHALVHEECPAGSFLGACVNLTQGKP